MLFLELNQKNIFVAAGVLKAGGLAAFPTETVYGLGCDAFNSTALARVFEVKRRPRFDPLIVHISRLETLQRLADFGLLSPVERERVRVLSQSLWPGPLTLILPKKDAVPPLATGGLATVAVRFPAHDAALALIRKSTGAIAAPSANLFGSLSPTLAAHVRTQLGEAVDVILDGGKCGIGVESTVLDIRGTPRILRHGGTPRDKIETLIGSVGASGAGPGDSHVKEESVESPGQTASHYAPGTSLFLHAEGRLSALEAEADAAYLFFSRASAEGFAAADGENVFFLSESGSVREAAARLFETLHTIDSLHFARIHAEKVPAEGLGPAINDRLSRAQSCLRR